jgi:hypothetical protein
LNGGRGCRELKWSFGGPLSKLCVTSPFSINFRCQIKNQVSDYRILGASISLISKYKKILFRFENVLWLPDSTSNISIDNLIYLRVLHKKWSDLYTPRKQSLGVYRNHPVRPSIRLSVHPSFRPSMYLVSATRPKPLIGFLWNFTQL